MTYFYLTDISADVPSASESLPETASSSADQKLTRDDLSMIEKLLENHSTKWRDIGNSLGFPPDELDSISARPSLLQSAPSSYLQELLKQWLEWPTKYHPNPPTLEVLRAALEKEGLSKIAEEVGKEIAIRGT